MASVLIYRGICSMIRIRIVRFIVIAFLLGSCRMTIRRCDHVGQGEGRDGRADRRRMMAMTMVMGRLL